MPPGINHGTTTGELVIGAVNLHCPAWCALNLIELWVPGDVRGSDRIIPGAAGVRPYRRRLTVTEFDIEMVITGFVDPAGVVNADPWVGLEENINALKALVTDSPDADGTWPATLTMPSTEERTADVHVLALRIGELGIGATLAALEISIPQGVFS